MNECDYGCPSRMSEADTEKFAQCLQRLALRRRIDWSKVRTFDDLLCVFSTLFGDASVEPDSALAKKLERFLEPKKQD
jgi:hypothetical protein